MRTGESGFSNCVYPNVISFNRCSFERATKLMSQFGVDAFAPSGGGGFKFVKNGFLTITRLFVKLFHLFFHQNNLLRMGR